MNGVKALVLMYAFPVTTDPNLNDVNLFQIKTQLQDLFWTRDDTQGGLVLANVNPNDDSQLFFFVEQALIQYDMSLEFETIAGVRGFNTPDAAQISTIDGLLICMKDFRNWIPGTPLPSLGLDFNTVVPSPRSSNTSLFRLVPNYFPPVKNEPGIATYILWTDTLVQQQKIATWQVDPFNAKHYLLVPQMFRTPLPPQNVQQYFQVIRYPADTTAVEDMPLTARQLLDNAEVNLGFFNTGEFGMENKYLPPYFPTCGLTGFDAVSPGMVVKGIGADGSSPVLTQFCSTFNATPPNQRTWQQEMLFSFYLSNNDSHAEPIQTDAYPYPRKQYQPVDNNTAGIVPLTSELSFPLRFEFIGDSNEICYIRHVGGNCDMLLERAAPYAPDPPNFADVPINGLRAVPAAIVDIGSVTNLSITTGKHMDGPYYDTFRFRVFASEGSIPLTLRQMDLGLGGGRDDITDAEFDQGFANRTVLPNYEILLTDFSGAETLAPMVLTAGMPCTWLANPPSGYANSFWNRFLRRQSFPYDGNRAEYPSNPIMPEVYAWSQQSLCGVSTGLTQTYAQFVSKATIGHMKGVNINGKTYLPNFNGLDGNDNSYCPAISFADNGTVTDDPVVGRRTQVKGQRFVANIVFGTPSTFVQNWFDAKDNLASRCCISDNPPEVCTFIQPSFGTSLTYGTPSCNAFMSNFCLTRRNPIEVAQCACTFPIPSGIPFLPSSVDFCFDPRCQLFGYLNPFQAQNQVCSANICAQAIQITGKMIYFNGQQTAVCNGQQLPSNVVQRNDFFSYVATTVSSSTQILQEEVLPNIFIVATVALVLSVILLIIAALKRK